MRPEMKFVGRMRALFGAPDADATAVIDEYTNALSGQSAATLDRAADSLARTHKFRSWPTVAECLDAVAEAKRTVNTASMGLEKIGDFDGWWSERIARIRIAKTDKQINDVISTIEPYATAQWIAANRLPEAYAVAAEVRAGWLAQRKTGEAA